MRVCCHTATTNRRAPILRQVRVLETVSELEQAVVSDQVKAAVLDQVAVATSAAAIEMTAVVDQAAVVAAAMTGSLRVRTSRRKHVCSRSLSRSTRKTHARTRLLAQ